MMRSIIAPALLLLSALTRCLAQSSLTSAAAELPQCALNCLTTAVAHSTCAPTDQTCLCTNAPLQANVTICVSTSCTVTEALFTKNITSAACGAPVRNHNRRYRNIVISFGVISATAVFARLIFKAVVMMSELGWDDYFILISLLAGVPSDVLILHGMVPNGMAKDIWTLSPAQITTFLRYFYLTEPFYFAQVTLLKTSILFFYKRIFPNRIVQRLLCGTLIFNAVFGLAFVLVAILQCQPINYFWHSWDGLHKGKCLNINAVGWSNASISISVDLWMLAIPISQLPQLNLHWKKKLGVAMMFLVGTFVTVVSILRLQSLVVFGQSTNPTFDLWLLNAWSDIEINVGIICACMPAMRLILVRLFPKMMGVPSSLKQRYYGNDSARSKNRIGNSSVGDAKWKSADGRGFQELGDSDNTRLVPLVNMNPTHAKMPQASERALPL